jgi:LPXTG-site transpeptidase (sortase) family protein
MEKRIKILLKYFFVFFLIGFFIFNWQKVYWVFNWQALSGLFSEFLSQRKIDFPKISTSQIDQQTTTSQENILEIPKFNLKAPIVLAGPNEKIEKALNHGVVLFPGSALPGKPGQTMILGHSAPPNWPNIRYDRVFSNLNQLEEGDEIFVYFQGEKYRYLAKRKIFLKKNEELPKTESSKNFLFLISCWPPGKDLKRIAVEAELE